MLEARNVTLAHGRKSVVQGVDLTLHVGEVLALCGPNGAGKSTMLSAFAGDLRAVGGDVRLDHTDMRDLSAKELARQRAVLEQSPSLSAPFTVEELSRLSIPLELPPDATDETVNGILQRLGLTEMQHTPVHELSGGQQHRAHLARTLCQLEAGRQLGGGKYLLLDEPTASLDIAHQIAVMEAAYVTSRQNSGVMVVLHDLNLAAAFSDRIGLMADGKIVAIGTPTEVLTEACLSDVYHTPISVNLVDGKLTIAPVFNQMTLAAE